MITGVILTHNEEHNVLACIEALRPHVGEIILIDTESTDRTVPLALPHVDLVLTHPHVPNFDAARNLAIPRARFDWMWFVDADERIPSRTGQLVNMLVATRGDQFEAINIPFKSYFCGQWMRHCGWWPGYTVCRVLKRGHFEFNRILHGGVKLNGREYRFPPDPEIAVLHNSFINLEHYVTKFNRYTTTESLQLAERGVLYNWQTAIHMMMHDLWQHYELNSARMDGDRGWVLTWMAGQYRWLSHTKLIDDRRAGSKPEAATSVPTGLNEVLLTMERELAWFRKDRPIGPLGLVVRMPTTSDSWMASEPKCFAKALSRGQRCLTLEGGVADSFAACAANDHALFKALTRARRADSVITISHVESAETLPDPFAVFNVLRASSTFEGEHISPEEARRAMQFDEIWLPTAEDALAFRRSGVPSEKFRIVPRCYDEAPTCAGDLKGELPDATRGRFVFTSIADLRYESGWDCVVEAFCQEFTPDDAVALIICYDSDSQNSRSRLDQMLEAVLAKSAEPLIGRPNLLVHGVAGKTLATILSAADCCVVPSRSRRWAAICTAMMAGGIPTVVSESMKLEFMTATNCIIVSAPPAAVRQIVRIAKIDRAPDSSETYVNQPDIHELRQAMRRVWTDPGFRDSLANGAVESVRNEFGLARASRELDSAIAAIEDRVFPSHAPPVYLGQLRVELRGEFFAGHSFSNINEQLALTLSDEPSVALALRPVASVAVQVDRSSKRRRLQPLLHRSFDEGPQITIRHAFPPDFSPVPFGRWVHIQPWEFGCLPNDWLPALRSQVDEVWAPSHYVKRVYIRSGVPGSKIHVIPWGVDPGIFNLDAPPLRLTTDREFRFLFVGGTIARKGFDRLLAAYLAEFNPSDDVCLVVKDMGSQTFYAHQNHRAAIMEAIKNPSNPQILYFEDEFTPSQLASLYRACDCLVAPYRGEGFGLPILEAMFCGLPPIVPLGGASDDFTTDDCAFRMPSAESPNPAIPGLCGIATELNVEIDDIRQLMRRAFSDPLETRRRGLAAREYVAETFTWSNTARLIVDRLRAIATSDPQIGERDRAITKSAPTTAPHTIAGPEPRLAAVLKVGLDVDLPDILARVRPFVDYLVIECQPDNIMRQIALEYGCITCNEPNAGFNLALDRLGGEAGSNWILRLQGAQNPSEICLDRLKPFLETLPKTVLAVCCREMTSDSQNLAGLRDDLCVIRADERLLAAIRDPQSLAARIEQFGGTVVCSDVFGVSRSRPSQNGVTGQNSQSVARDLPHRVSSQRSRDEHPSCVLIQMADGPHVALLEATREHHRRYAELHGMEYWAVFGNPAAPKAPGWGKISLILRAMASGFDRIVWLDADAVIVQFGADLSKTIDSGIGMVRHPNPTHWNSGVIVVVRDAMTERFFRRVEAAPDNADAWMEQRPINELADLAEFAPLITALDPAFNSTPGAVMADDAVVLAAHGLPLTARRDLVCSWIKMATSRPNSIHISRTLLEQGIGERRFVAGLGSRLDFGPFLNELGLLGHAVEVGVLRGEFSRLLLSNWRGEMLHLVDPWKHLAGYEDIHNLSDPEHEQCLSEVHERLRPYSGRYAIHRMLSREAACLFVDASLDFVYIDADHKYEAVVEDLRLWFGKVRAGGVLAGHDYLDGDLPEGNFGVLSAVREFERLTNLRVSATQEPRWPSWYFVKPRSTVAS